MTTTATTIALHVLDQIAATRHPYRTSASDAAAVGFNLALTQLISVGWTESALAAHLTAVGGVGPYGTGWTPEFVAWALAHV